MVRLNRVVPFATLLVLSSFAARADSTTYEFASVTGIVYGRDSFQQSTLSVVGVLANTTTPTTVMVPVSSSPSHVLNACTGFFSQMISTPAIYTLTFVVTTTTQPNPGPGDPAITVSALTNCRLDRNP